MDERVYLKVKIKSLADEARIIKREIKGKHSPSIKNGLRLHHINVVRVEARHTHLAYGFLRGREYWQLERKAKEAPDWKKVRRMIEKYGTHCWWHYNEDSYSAYEQRKEESQRHLRETLERFDKWVIAAKKGNPVVDEAVNG